MARRSTGKNILMAVNILALLLLGAATGYLFFENRDLNDQVNLTSTEKNRRLVDEINQVFDLPDEEPVVAVVTNVDDFKAEYGVFDNAEEGDYLLFFRKARLNVLYRQREKRVVKTADVNVPIAVELVGSQKAIEAVKKVLTQFGSQIEIEEKVTDGITQSFVFDIDGDQTEQAKSIAEQLDYDVGSTLPSTVTPADNTEIMIAVTETKPSSSRSNDASGQNSDANQVDESEATD